MSSNRLSYDTCAYKADIAQSTLPLSYTLNPMKYENCNKCRMELGIVGGTDVSQIKGNLVDLENDLRGQTRQASLCPGMKYMPTDSQTIQLQASLCGKEKTIDTSLVHLPACQMIQYKPVALPPAMRLESCPAPVRTNLQAACKPAPMAHNL